MHDSIRKRRSASNSAHPPTIADHAIEIGPPGSKQAHLRDVLRLNAGRKNFRIFGPDETASNRLGSVFEKTNRVWLQKIEEYDVYLARDDRVMEILSEHLCQGLEGTFSLAGTDFSRATRLSSTSSTRVLGLAAKVPDVTEKLKAKLAEDTAYITESGKDMADITGCRWRRA